MNSLFPEVIGSSHSYNEHIWLDVTWCPYPSYQLAYHVNWQVQCYCRIMGGVTVFWHHNKRLRSSYNDIGQESLCTTPIWHRWCPSKSGGSCGEILLGCCRTFAKRVPFNPLPHQGRAQLCLSIERCCGEYHKLNTMARKDVYSLPWINVVHDTLDALTGDQQSTLLLL